MIYGMAEPFQHAMHDRGGACGSIRRSVSSCPAWLSRAASIGEHLNESFLRKEYVDRSRCRYCYRRLMARYLSLNLPRRSNTSPSALHHPRNLVNEPVADFSRAPVRIAMADAIAHRRKQLGKRLDLSRSRLICQRGLICRRMIPVGRISSSRWCRVISLPISRRLPRLPRPPKSPETRPVADRVAVMRAGCRP